ncbi:hypothetical protein BUALT_Bualt19G0026600 [Buddleja alternifolia]|uniref:RING-type domain-containing protein n=1 Tax=Buddleja alternifolia TaxID=168488 RepID=A0AAV6W0Z9_9LAMI|nr:hypothetical protein BUALT_Bualt19G0026600 [Buddleja alternifolia]
MSTSLPPPPPIAVVYGGSLIPTAVDATQIPQLPPPYSDTSSSSSSASAIIVILIIASAVIISASIYLLLRFLSNRLRRTSSSSDVVSPNHNSPNHNSNTLKRHVASDDFSDSLPLFTFGAVTGNLTGGDCAVCLSKFEPHDQLRLLPLCCHAFHAACIDAWLVSNRTCPLCRSTVLPSASDALDKILSSGDNTANTFTNRDANSGSFRIQIGSISRRRDGGATAVIEAPPRSYSIGSFDYVLDDNGYEISTNELTIEKESSLEILTPEPAAEALAAEVSGRRNWLREYVDRLTSVSVSYNTMPFRNSGRFFSGSSRRNDTAAAAASEDLEANRVGEEISELFRWFSGV